MSNALARFEAAMGDRIAGHGRGRCPASGHEDHNASLSWSYEGGKVLVCCHAGCSTGAIVSGLGTTMAALFDTPAPRTRRTIVDTYEYRYNDEPLLFQKVRYEPKDFQCRKPDGAGGWIYKKVMQGITPPLYNRPEVDDAISRGAVVFQVEGEKDVHTMRAHGFVATCNYLGAANEGRQSTWGKREASQLEGAADVVSIPDNDDAGRAHSRAVVESLRGSGARVRVVMLPNLPPKGDVTDWFNAGGTAEALRALVDAAPVVEWADEATDDDAPDVAGSDATPKDLSEDALATRFTAYHGENRRYAKMLGRWYLWTGTHLQEDTKLQVFNDARSIARAATIETGTSVGLKEWKKVRSAATIAAIERIARADPVHAIAPDEMDADPWILNAPGVVHDLRSGARLANDPKYRCTKITAVAGEGDAPVWRAALEVWTQHRPEIMRYLQRLAGYSLTGSTREHVLVFFYGSGGNGKSAFLSALAGCMGTYATSAPIATFTESGHDQHPTDLARLRGARLVSTTETEANRRWAEAKVKQLTGGDRIAARFMRQDFFEFDPQFTLIVAGNHRPRFSSIDESIRRRLHIVPFDACIPIAQRDPLLPEKLRAEWPGILAWALEGCAAWQREGLNPPDAVLSATADYLDSEDTLGAWLAECVERDGSAWSASSDLFGSWQTWAHARNENVGTGRKLTEELARRGFQPKRTGAARGFEGIRLIPMTQLTIPAHIDVPRAPAHDAHAHTRTHVQGNTEAPSTASWAGSDLLCIDCGKVALSEPGRTCHWCQKRARTRDVAA